MAPDWAFAQNLMAYDAQRSIVLTNLYCFLKKQVFDKNYSIPYSIDFPYRFFFLFPRNYNDELFSL
jgi:hypothetical protein